MIRLIILSLLFIYNLISNHVYAPHHPKPSHPNNRILEFSKLKAWIFDSGIYVGISLMPSNSDIWLRTEKYLILQI